jgi:PAS domain-containing protein
MPGEQHPVEIILARSLMSNLTTPAFLVGLDGTLVYFNDAAADLLGLRFEEAGPLPAEDWGTRFVPRDDDGNPLDVPDLPLSIALATGQPSHGRMRLQTPAGAHHHIEVHALPIFWEIPDAD